MVQIFDSIYPIIVVINGVLIVALLFLYIGPFGRRKRSKEKNTKDSNNEDLTKFKLAVEYSTDGLVITDKQANIIYVNSAWEELTGYKKEEVVGKNPRILKSGKTEERVYEEMWSSLKKGKPFETEEIINTRKDGSKYEARLEIFPIRDKGEVMYVGIENDITKRKIEEEAKTEFVSLASHQLRTPLSVIDWYTETLLSGSVGTLNDKQKSYVHELYKTNQHMLNLVDMLLNTSRLELGTFSVEPEPTNILKVTQNILEELKPKIDVKKLSIQTEFDESIPTIRIDKNLLRIILQNIISNAIRYTQSNGPIWISLKLAKQGTRVKERYISVDSVLVSIQDGGIGIPKDEQSKIFSKLFRASNAKLGHTNGTGLGLYIVKSVLDQTNGSIWFESEENVGTTFYVVLPLRGIHSKKPISVIGEKSD